MKHLTAFFLFVGLIHIAMAQSTLIVAHRGFSSIAPENTLSAFEEAIACGAPYFELDVQASADGVPMVIHDETLDRTSSSGHQGRVDARTREELEQVHVGYSSKFGDQFATEPLPTLAQSLALARGRIQVCVEIEDAPDGRFADDSVCKILVHALGVHEIRRRGAGLGIRGGHPERGACIEKVVDLHLYRSEEAAHFMSVISERHYF